MPRLPDEHLPDWFLAFYSIIGLLLVVLWLIFPFIVYVQLNQLIKLGKDQLDQLERIARNSSKSGDTSPTNYLADTGPNVGGAMMGALVLLALGVIGFVIYSNRGR